MLIRPTIRSLNLTAVKFCMGSNEWKIFCFRIMSARTCIGTDCPLPAYVSARPIFW